MGYPGSFTVLGAQGYPEVALGGVESLLLGVSLVVLGDKLSSRDEFGEVRAIDKHLLQLPSYLFGVFADGNGVTNLEDAHLFEPVPGDKGTILDYLLHFFGGGFLELFLGGWLGGISGVEEQVNEAIFVAMHNNNANKIILDR